LGDNWLIGVPGDSIALATTWLITLRARSGVNRRARAWSWIL
jgi:hypothetical protein